MSKLRNTAVAAVVAAGAAITAAPAQAQNTPPGPGTPITPDRPTRPAGPDCTTPGCFGGGTPSTTFNNYGGSATANASASNKTNVFAGGGYLSVNGSFCANSLGLTSPFGGIGGSLTDDECHNGYHSTSFMQMGLQFNYKPAVALGIAAHAERHETMRKAATIVGANVTKYGPKADPFVLAGFAEPSRAFHAAAFDGGYRAPRRQHSAPRTQRAPKCGC